MGAADIPGRDGHPDARGPVTQSVIIDPASAKQAPRVARIKGKNRSLGAPIGVEDLAHALETDTPEKSIGS